MNTTDEALGGSHDVLPHVVVSRGRPLSVLCVDDDPNVSGGSEVSTEVSSNGQAV